MREAVSRQQSVISALRTAGKVILALASLVFSSGAFIKYWPGGCQGRPDQC